MQTSWETIGLIAAIVHTFSWLAAGHALLHKRDSRSALGWAAVCLLTPIFGPLLYVLFGIARVESRAARIMSRAAQTALGANAPLVEGFFSDTPRGSVPLSDLPHSFRAVARPGWSLTHRRIVGGNAITPLQNGEEAYPQMLEAIRTAKQRVYLSTFIFSHDHVGRLFANALMDAARRGLDVRLLIDGVGAFRMGLPLLGWASRLSAAGVRVARFLPPGLIPPRFNINLRTHRKLLICDRTVAFTGGMNISAHHLCANARKNRVSDLHFRCSGPIVSQLLVCFLMDWDFVTGDAAHTPLEPPIASTGKSFCRLVMDGPGTMRDPIHDLFCAMISASKHRVRIVSPYFLPTQQLTSALCSAVLRGVRVDVILPKLNNHPPVDWAMRHQLPELIKKGVRIAFQPPPFAHTKLLLVDSAYTLMGSANLDPRSLNLNFELVVEIIDQELNSNLANYFDSLLVRSSPFPDKTASLPVRLRNAVCWLMSPYL